MSNYIKTTNFAAKDSLPSGNPAKIVKGTEINTEFDNIAVASATKLNSSAVSTFGGTLIDDANASAARTTLGLGTAATTASTDYATAAQGATADAALPRTGGAMTGAITTNSTFDGRDVATDGTKLDGIEAGADVTDTTNVTAAGALMDSEVTNLAQVKSFDSADYATAAQGTTADAALPRTGGAMTGAITTNSTFDGRDVATDGTKLDGIEASADVTDTANVTAAGALMTTGGTLTGDLNFGDNDKATFGAGDDLQIYHDGNSFVSDNGAGNLYLTTNDAAVVLSNADGSKPLAIFNNNADSTVYFNGLAKLATTATGIDVTGTVVSDGLTVSTSGTNAEAYFDNGAQSYRLLNRSSDNAFSIFDNTASAFRLTTASNGDISFYEDTGTTPKFFWDASAESLGIGTSSPSSLLHVLGSPVATSGALATFRNSDATSSNTSFGGVVFNSSPGTDYSIGKSNVNSVTTLSFRNANTGASYMDIDASGNVGIGTSSPSTLLHLNSTNPRITLTDTTLEGNCNHVIRGSDQFLLISADDGNTQGTSSLRFNVDASEAMRIDSSGNVGIGTSSPTAKLTVSGTGVGAAIDWINTTASTGRSYRWVSLNNGTGFALEDLTAGSEAMRIDSSGNLLVGTTNVDPAGADVAGTAIGSTGYISMSRSSGAVGIFNRKTNDGNILEFNKDGTTVGSIGVKDGYLTAGNADAGLLFLGSGVKRIQPWSVSSNSGVDNQIDLGYSTERFKDLYLSGTAYVATDGVLSETAEAGSTFYFSNNNIGLKAYSYISSNRLIPCDENGANRDNYVDLGQSNARFDDIYATNGTIQTSDRNEKQDIAELSDAEQRVAVACKGLLRKFRWKSAAEEKGDEARIHFGIIAQDLQAAFAAEGLDAGDYGMFISTTWTDEETNEEKTRLGVRYSELLAFIISAL